MDFQLPPLDDDVMMNEIDEQINTNSSCTDSVSKTQKFIAPDPILKHTPKPAEVNYYNIVG